MTIRKIIVVSLLVVVASLCLLTAWWFASGENWAKGKIEASVSELTGRTFSIDGAFSLDLSANPVVVAENIRLSNPPWAVHPDLIRLDRLEVYIELASLLAEPVRVNFIDMQGLVVALEEQASGEKSWDILPGQEQPPAPAEKSPAELPVSIDRITLADFSLLHEAPQRTVPLDFHLEQLEVIQGGDQQLQFNTGGRFGGEPFQLAGNLGPLDELARGGNTRHDIRLSVGEIVLQSQGTIEQTSTLAGANVELVFSGPEFEWILTRLALPEFSHGVFDFNLNVRTEGSQTRLDLAGDLGSLQARVKGSFDDLANIASANLSAEIAGDDIGSLLELAGVPGVAHDPFSLQADIDHAADSYRFNTLEIAAGGNSLSVSGQMGDWPKLANTQLDFSLAGPDLSAWAPLLKLDDLPASAFSLSGGISPVDAGLKLENVKLELGGSQLVVNGTTGAPPGFSGTALGIEAAGPSLAEFRFLPGLEKAPGLPFQLKGGVGKDDTGLTFNELDVKLGENSLRLGGRLGLNGQFAGSDLTTRAVIPNLAALGPVLGLEGLPEQRLSVNANCQRTADGWAFQLSNGKFADASFESEGTYSGMKTGLRFAATSRVTAPDLAGLARAAGVESIAGLPALPVSIGGFAHYETGRIELRDINGSVGESVFSISAGLVNPPAWTGSNINVSASGPDIGPLLENYAIDDALPFSLQGSVTREDRGIRLSRLEARLGPSDLSGEVNVDLTARPRVNGVLRSNYLDLAWLRVIDEEDGSGKKPAEPGKQAYLIPDRPIEYERMDIADIDVDIAVNKIDFPQLAASDFHTHTRIVDGNLFMDTFQVRGMGGALLGGNLAVVRETGSGVTRIALAVEGQGVKLGIGAAEGQDPETIRKSEIVANLNASGVSYRDLAKSLDGYIEVVQGPGLTESAGYGLIFGDFIGELLGTLNPFAKTEKFTKNECAVGIVNIDSGVLTLDPIVSQTDKLTLVAKGAVDLHTEEIRFTFNTKLRKGIGVSASMMINPFVGITGTLASPVVGLDPAALAVKGSVAVATVGISLLARSVSDRFFSSKDPCGDALKGSRETLESAGEKGRRDQRDAWAAQLRAANRV